MLRIVSGDDIPVAHTPPGGYGRSRRRSPSRMFSVLRFLFWNTLSVERVRERIGSACDSPPGRE